MQVTGGKQVAAEKAAAAQEEGRIQFPCVIEYQEHTLGADGIAHGLGAQLWGGPIGDVDPQRFAQAARMLMASAGSQASPQHAIGEVSSTCGWLAKTAARVLLPTPGWPWSASVGLGLPHSSPASRATSLSRPSRYLGGRGTLSL